MIQEIPVPGPRPHQQDSRGVGSGELHFYQALQVIVGPINIGSRRSQVGKNETKDQSSSGSYLAKVDAAKPAGTRHPWDTTRGQQLGHLVPRTPTVLNTCESGCRDLLC